MCGTSKKSNQPTLVSLELVNVKISSHVPRALVQGAMLAGKYRIRVYSQEPFYITLGSTSSCNFTVNLTDCGDGVGCLVSVGARWSISPGF